MRIEGVQVAKPVRVREMRTGFGKQPVLGAVRVGRTNLEGDGQADPRYHGGEDMAVLAYSADHYAAWRAELSWPGLPLGGFGENLSVSGAAEHSVCVGDVWRAGSAVLQVSSPRNPCSKISRYWGRPQLLQLVRERGRIGWYLRILEEGQLRAGDAIAMVDRPHPEWTISRAFGVMLAGRADRDAARELARVEALPERWKARLRG